MSPGTERVLLRLTQVRRSYGPVVALTDVSLELRRGSVLALLGPNGAGKSTMLSITAGLLRPDRGTVLRRAGVRIGFLPQEHALYPTLTARENLVFICRALGLGKSTIAAELDRVLGVVGLEDRRDDRVAGYSGGMKRRLGYAAAILGRPDVLLLDEPTAGVDPQSRNDLLELVETEVRRGVAVIYSTHYMEEAERIADEVLVLSEGVVRFAGALGQLLSQHGTTSLELEAVGVGSDRLRDALAHGLPAVTDCAVVRDGPQSSRLRMTVLDRSSALERVLEISHTAGLRISDLRLHEPTLESAFMSMTRHEAVS